MSMQKGGTDDASYPQKVIDVSPALFDGVLLAPLQQIPLAKYEVEEICIYFVQLLGVRASGKSWG